MTREEFNKQPSYGKGEPCPDCDTRKTAPYPGCHCPEKWNGGFGPFTTHIMEWHHDCQKK